MENKCDYLEETASYVRAELSGDRLAEWETHLAECDCCSSLVRDFRHVIGQVQAVPSLEVSSGFTDSVLRAVHQSSDGANGSSPDCNTPMIRFAPLLRVAAVFIALLSVLWLVMERSEPVGSEPSGGDPTSLTDQRGGVFGDAVNWLMSAQEEDGAWDPVRWEGRKEFQVALTGMSLMTLLEGQGADRVRDDAIDRAVTYLGSVQGDDGALGPANDARMYNQGIALTALIRAYEARGGESLKAVIEKGLAYIRMNQTASGGWAYSSRDGARPNTAVSVWQLQALQQAERAGISDDFVALRKGLFWLQGLVNDRGHVGYDRLGSMRGGTESLTAMGAFCLFEAESSFAELGQLNERIAAGLSDDNLPDGGASDFYQAYFLVSAMQSRQGEQAQDVLTAVQKSLLASRVEQGGHRGSWEPVGRWSSVGGRLYSTCLAALSLHAG